MWLRAIPNRNLSLAMPQQEFIVAIKMWIGIHLFPPPPPLPPLHLWPNHQPLQRPRHFIGCGHGHCESCDTIPSATPSGMPCSRTTATQFANNIVERGTADLGIPTTLTSSRGSQPILIFLLGAPSNPNTSIERPIRQVQQGRPARLRRMLAKPSKWKMQGSIFPSCC